MKYGKSSTKDSASVSPGRHLSSAKTGEMSKPKKEERGGLSETKKRYDNRYPQKRTGGKV